MRNRGIEYSSLQLEGSRLTMHTQEEIKLSPQPKARKLVLHHPYSPSIGSACDWGFFCCDPFWNFLQKTPRFWPNHRNHNAPVEEPDVEFDGLPGHFRHPVSSQNQNSLEIFWNVQGPVACFAASGDSRPHTCEIYTWLPCQQQVKYEAPQPVSHMDFRHTRGSQCARFSLRLLLKFTCSKSSNTRGALKKETLPGLHQSKTINDRTE